MLLVPGVHTGLVELAEELSGPPDEMGEAQVGEIRPDAVEDSRRTCHVSGGPLKDGDVKPSEASVVARLDAIEHIERPTEAFSGLGQRALDPDDAAQGPLGESLQIGEAASLRSSDRLLRPLTGPACLTASELDLGQRGEG